MRDKKLFSLVTLIGCLLITGLFFTLAYLLLKPSQKCMPQEVTILFGLGGGLVLVLWGGLHIIMGRFLRTQSIQSPALSSAPKPVSHPVESDSLAPPQTAFQAVLVLSLLQRQGRFVDFLNENLDSFEDDQIGAAVRSIHQGCRQALAEVMDLKPIFEQEEGTSLTVPGGFDAKSIRLTGHVVGNPPFKGVLRHRGWKVVRIDLPKLLTQPTGDQEWVVAPAEVEIGNT